MQNEMPRQKAQEVEKQEVYMYLNRKLQQKKPKFVHALVWWWWWVCGSWERARSPYQMEHPHVVSESRLFHYLLFLFLSIGIIFTLCHIHSMRMNSEKVA